MDQLTEPTLFDAIRKHRWFVAFAAVVGLVFGLLAGVALFNDWVATSSVLVEDPASSQVFDQPTAQDPRRYVADQVAILESTGIAERSLEIATANNEVGEVAINDLLERRQIDSQPDSALVEVSVKAKDPAIAIALSLAFLDAYRELREIQAATGFDVAMGELDSSLEIVDQELDVIDEELQGLSSTAVGRARIGSQIRQATEELLSLISGPLETTPEQFESVLQQLQTLELIRSIQAQDPTLAALIGQRTEALERRLQLVLRRDQLAIDAVVTTSGVVLSSPARDAERSMGYGRLGLIGLFLGMATGALYAYRRALRSRRFEHRFEPEVMVNAALLAEVPNFRDEKLSGSLPIRDAPVSAAAESYRFAAAAISNKPGLSASTSESGEQAYGSIAPRIFAITSPLLGDGKTTTLANVGIAVAAKGKRVLLVDADFGDQALTRTISDPPDWNPGLTDVVEGMSLLAAVSPINIRPDLTVDLLSRGTKTVAAPEFFGTLEVQAFFSSVNQFYDVVLVDVPPILQVAYAGSIVRFCDSAIVVVPHGSEFSMLIETVDRISLVRTPIAGYVYNKAPLRPEIKANQGSMRDPLGLGAEQQEELQEAEADTGKY